MDRKTQYCQDVDSSQFNLCNAILNQKHSKLFCGYSQTDSKIYMERQKSQNNQHNIEKEQNWRTDSNQCQESL